MKYLGRIPKQPTDSQLSALINAMSDGVIAADDRGVVILNNAVALSLLDINTIDARNISEVMHLKNNQGDRIDVANLLQKARQQILRGEYKIRYQDGSEIDLSLSISAVNQTFGSAGQAGFMMVLRDITQEKSLEQERDEFIGVASHELRTPIAIAEGSLSNAILLGKNRNLPAVIGQSLKESHHQILFLQSLINDLATLSRAERGKLALTKEVFRPTELFNELTTEHAPIAKNKGLEFRSNAKLGKDMIETSRLYVKEILQNLLTNAIKYTEKGGVDFQLEEIDNQVIFSVRDSGIGIPTSEKSRLFSKFFRSQDWRVQNQLGSGLGLYVSAKLVALIGGQIQVESTVGKGSYFRLILPA